MREEVRVTQGELLLTCGGTGMEMRVICFSVESR